MMWLVETYWRLCGIFTADLSYNKYQYVYSLFLMSTCVYNFVNASETLCKMDRWCVVFSTSLIGMYDRVLSSTVFFSRIVTMLKAKKNTLKYKATIKAFEVYSPTSLDELRNNRIFTFVIIFLCLIIILPINFSRLYYLYFYEEEFDVSLLVYFVFIYVQNLSMCCIETQFVSQCFLIYTKFRKINGDLRNLKERNINHVKFPFLVDLSGTAREIHEKSTQCVRYDNDFYRPRFESHPMANTVEVLRIRHWLIRQAVEILNNLFGIQMGLSVFSLWVMALFDIYYEIFHDSPSKILVYGWMLQYSLRLFMIMLVAHYTTKQVR